MYFHWNCQRKEYFRSGVGSTGCIRNLPEKAICSKNAKGGRANIQVFLTNVFMPVPPSKIIGVIPLHTKNNAVVKDNVLLDTYLVIKNFLICFYCF